MVKQIWAFVRWQFSLFTWDNYFWFAGFGLIGAGYGRNDNLIFVGVAFVLVALLGAVIKNQWERWKNERKELFNTIQNSK